MRKLIGTVLIVSLIIMLQLSCGGGSSSSETAGRCTKCGVPERLPADIVNMSTMYLSAKLVDIDNDGDLDLVLGNWGGQTSRETDRILLNDGHGYFTDAAQNVLPPRLMNKDWLTTDIGAADVDDDGYTDLLMVVWAPDYSDTRLQLLMNNKDGTFKDASDLIASNDGSFQVHNGWVRFADLDNDGAIDFITSTAIYRNNGTGFTATASNKWLSSVVADFNNDGLPDLVSGLSTLSLLRNASTGPGNLAFTEIPTSYSLIGGDAATVTLDLGVDGDNDIFIAQYEAFGPVAQTVKIFENQNGSFVTASGQTTATLFHPINTVVVADFNNDGRQDVFIGDAGKDSVPFPGGQNRILIQNSSGVLVDETDTRLPIRLDYTHGMAIGDIDNDGDIDIYLANITSQTSYSPGFLINDGSGHFTLGW